MNIVAFDIDGVLLKAFQFGPTFQAEHRIPDKAMQIFWAELFPDCTLGRADLHVVLKQQLETWGLSLNVDEVCNSWFEMDGGLIEPGLNLFAECRERFDKVVLASTQEKYRAAYIATTYAFAKSADRLYFSCDIGYKKPQQAFYRYIVSDMNDSHIVFFDDSLVNVEAAKLLGWQAYRYTGQRSLREFGL